MQFLSCCLCLSCALFLFLLSPVRQRPLPPEATVFEGLDAKPDRRTYLIVVFCLVGWTLLEACAPQGKGRTAAPETLPQSLSQESCVGV